MQTKVTTGKMCSKWPWNQEIIIAMNEWSTILRIMEAEPIRCMISPKYAET